MDLTAINLDRTCVYSFATVFPNLPPDYIRKYRGAFVEQLSEAYPDHTVLFMFTIGLLRIQRNVGLNENNINLLQKLFD